MNTTLCALDVSNVEAAIKGLIGMCNALGAEGGEAGSCNSTLQALDIGAHSIHAPQVVKKHFAFVNHVLCTSTLLTATPYAHNQS